MIHTASVTFYDDINQGFACLIEDYGFDVITKVEHRKVVISNGKCNIDMEDTDDGLNIFIREPNCQKCYHPNLIYESLGGGIRIPWEVENSDSKRIIYSKRAKSLIKFIPNPLEGDFRWQEKYLILEAEQKELITKIMRLDAKHPVKQSFRQQKLSWKEDARKLKKGYI